MYKNKIIAGPTLYVESVSCGEDWCLGVEGTHPLTWKNKYNSSSHLFELMCDIQFVITLKTWKLHSKIILKAKRKKWKKLGDNLLINKIFSSSPADLRLTAWALRWWGWRPGRPARPWRWSWCPAAPWSCQRRWPARPWTTSPRSHLEIKKIF